MKIVLHESWFDAKSENSLDSTAYFEVDDRRVRLYINSNGDSEDAIVLDERAIHELSKLIAAAEEAIDEQLEE